MIVVLNENNIKYIKLCSNRVPAGADCSWILLNLSCTGHAVSTSRRTAGCLCILRCLRSSHLYGCRKYDRPFLARERQVVYRRRLEQESDSGKRPEPQFCRLAGSWEMESEWRWTLTNNSFAYWQAAGRWNQSDVGRCRWFLKYDYELRGTTAMWYTTCLIICWVRDICWATNTKWAK